MTITSVAMTSRQRWLAALDGEPVDRLPFWPKLMGAYPPAQSPPFSGMDLLRIHEWIGADPHVGLPGSVVKEVRSSSTGERGEGDDRRHRRVFVTPYGELHQDLEYDKPSASWHPVSFPVETREHIQWMAAWYRDVRVELNEPGLTAARAAAAQIGEQACSKANIGQTPLMHWVEWLAGIENAHYLLADYPSEAAELFDAMQANLVARARLLSEHHPADTLYLTENTSTTLISVAQYRDINLSQLRQVAEVVKAAGRRQVLHMCGHLKLLLPYLATLPVDAFEAFTSPTLGNTTLLDGRRACPDVTLVGGTHAMLWLESPDRIIRYIQARLDELPHHRRIIVTSAGVMPPMCSPQTIKAVCDWLKTYPLRV